MCIFANSIFGSCLVLIVVQPDETVLLRRRRLYGRPDPGKGRGGGGRGKLKETAVELVDNVGGGGTSADAVAALLVGPPAESSFNNPSLFKTAKAVFSILKWKGIYSLYSLYIVVQ